MEAGLHMIFIGGGGRCLAHARTDALRRAWKLSARSTSFADALMSIWCAATDERPDAYAIVAEWDARR